MKLLITLVAATIMGAAGLARAEEKARPNFVIIIADDLSFHDLGCWGNKDVHTPHLDQLAQEGVKLTGFFSPASVCAPTRQALLTGMFCVRNGAYPNHSYVKAGTKSLPHYLKALGYKTICVGKTHFGPMSCFPFDKFAQLPGLDEEDEGEGGKKPRAAKKAADDEDGLGILKRFIETNPAQPFCAYIASHDPHMPWTSGIKGSYDPAKLTLPPYLVDTPETRQGLAEYYAEVTHLDSQVEEVLRTLKQTGHEEDTLVLFVSEQGSAMPHGKWTCYDPGMHVAAIARWPGKIMPGSENPALVQYVDVLPTLIAAAGGDPTACNTGCPDATGNTGFDGRSLLDVLTGKTEQCRDYVFTQHTAKGIISGPPAYGTRSVRDTRWKLIVNLEPEAEFRNTLTVDAKGAGKIFDSWRKKGAAGDSFAQEQVARYIKRPAVELYDLQTDPWELTNVAADPKNADTIARLRAQLDSWMKQQGDAGDKTERAGKKH